jgi:hypothetical protein
MSLYYVQKLIYHINRDEEVKAAYLADRELLLSKYELDPEELTAFREEDFGRLYTMGVNGQLLMHYAAWRGLDWNSYIAAMRVGLETYGPVTAGIYAAVDDGQGGAI